MSTTKCRVDFTWDAESAVWIATSDDVEGLVLESGSFDALVERVRNAVPELLALNGSAPGVVDLSLFSTRNDLVTVNG